MGSIPGRGTKIPHATWRGQENIKKQKQKQKKNKNKQKLLAIPWRSRLGLQALTAEDPGSNPGPGTRIPQAARCGPGKTY